MKYIFVLFMAPLLFLSCSKDDDGAQENQLAAPILLTPSNNSTIEISDYMFYEFVWSNVENADQYLVQLASDPNFSNILSDATTTVDEDNPYWNTRVSFNENHFEHQRTYYWRVRAFGQGFEASDFSASFSFKVNRTN